VRWVRRPWDRPEGSPQTGPALDPRHDGQPHFAPQTRTKTTLDACRRLSRSCLRVIPGGPTRPLHTATPIVEHKIRVLNVAGNRESKMLGIGVRVERFLAEVFRQLSHTE
jgi:hypothetical protein